MTAETIQISIGTFSALGIIVSVGGTLIWGAWHLATRLTRVETKVEGFGSRLTGIEGRMDSAFGSASPVSLKPAGKKALEESGLKKWIDENKNDILTNCNDFNNPYDIQEGVFRLFEKLDFKDFEPKLKEAAFQYGWNEKIMRRIGGIYFRDICLTHKGFTPEDLDKPKS